MTSIWLTVSASPQQSIALREWASRLRSLNEKESWRAEGSGPRPDAEELGLGRAGHRADVTSRGHAFAGRRWERAAPERNENRSRSATRHGLLQERPQRCGCGERSWWPHAVPAACGLVGAVRNWSWPRAERCSAPPLDRHRWCALSSIPPNAAARAGKLQSCTASIAAYPLGNPLGILKRRFCY